MPTSAAPRTGITRWSAEADPFDRTQLDADHALLDDLVGIDLHDGLLAARPAVGIRGRYFTESAASAGLPGTTWREDGTAWRALGSRVLSTGTTDVAQVVAGVTGQTGNLQEWRAGASTLGHVDNTGQLFAVGAQLGPSPQTALAAMLGVTPTSAAAIAAIVRGAASQSADLQQWQSNAGTVLARVDSVGAGTFAGLTTAGTMTGRLARWSSAAAGDVPVQVTGFAGQTGNLTEWRSSTPTVVASIDPTGLGTFAGVTTAGTVTGRLARWTSAAVGDVPVIAKGFAGQTGDLQQWQSNAGGVLARIDSFGSMWISGSGARLFVGADNGAMANFSAPTSTSPVMALRGAAGQTAPLALLKDPTGATTQSFFHTDGAFHYGNGASTINNASGFWSAALGAKAVSASQTPLVIRAAASQSQPLTEWQNSSGVALAQVKNDGSMYAPVFGAGSTSYIGGALSAVPVNSSSIGAVVRALAGQSVNLQEWQNPSGSALSQVSASGDFFTTAAMAAGAAGYLGGAISAQPLATASQAIVARALASQTGDIVEWQSSAGTVLGQVAANGDLYVQALCVGPLSQAGSGVTSTYTTQLRPFDAGKRGLHVQGQVSQTAELTLWSNSANSTIAAVTASGNVQGTGAYTTLSDAAVKRNVRGLPHDSALAVINRLRPQLFDYIDGERDQVGFVAQQVAKHLPHAVVPFASSAGRPWDYDHLGVRSEAIVAYLVAAVQELAAAA